MRVYRSIRSLKKRVQEIKRKGHRIGLVPTMGFLHEGHMSLIRKARKETGCVVVSIFVNPAQFGPKDDFKKYPRDLKRDMDLCEREGVDIIFAPEPREMYSKSHSTYVNVEKIEDVLCGVSRSGHFRGVATVVAKLFNIVLPDIAYFGQKDIQQAIVIKRMAEDLNMNVKIKVMPIVREKNGLAMSSRNVYLSPKERVQAQSIYKSLSHAKELFDDGERNTGKIISKMRQVITKQPLANIDYVAIVDTENLKGIKKISGQALVAVAAWFGKTRLIDNIILN
jgi:pantoate--beta-alanine ligase